MLTILLLMMSGKSVWKWICGLGGPGLILLGLADNAPFFSAPAGSVDVLVILLASQSRELWGYYALMAAVGEIAGGYLTYRFAEKTGEKALEKKFGKQRAAQVYKWFEKRGTGLVVMVGAMLPPPFPFTSVLTAAGIVHYPRNRFLPCLFVGRSVRFFAVAYLGRAYGQQIIGFFSQYYRPALYVLIALAIASGIGALVYFKWYKPRAQRHDGDRD